VCGLRIGDVDTERSLLVVVGGKFGKRRLVPYGPRIAELVAAQLERRRAGGPALDTDAPLFTFDGRRCIHPGTASQTFHHLIPSLDLQFPPGSHPRGCKACGTRSQSAVCCVGIGRAWTP
jgi:integrase